MQQRVNDLKEFLKKVKELRGYGDMNSYILVRDYNQLAKETARDGTDDIITALSSPNTYDHVRQKMINNASEELSQLVAKR